jgi:hypothetical protein
MLSSRFAPTETTAILTPASSEIRVKYFCAFGGKSAQARQAEVEHSQPGKVS